jgi:hypothetical protein
MWKEKYFSTVEQRDLWIRENTGKYCIEIIYLNNGFGVEYKDLKYFL